MSENEIGEITSGSDMPFDAVAEQAVLGGILLDSDKLADVMEILPSGDYFHLATHKEIYSVMIELFTLSKPVDLITILDRLKGRRDISDGDTKNYLFQLADTVQVMNNIPYYASIVREKYLLRSLIMSAREIIYDAGRPIESISKLIDSAEQKIFDIRDDRSKNGLESISKVLVETFDRLDLLNSEESDLYKGIPTGIGQLDNVITGLNRSDLILLAARPGMGKTSFALNIAKHVAMKCKRKIAFFSLEMTKEQLSSRLLSMEALISGTTLRTGKLSQEEWTRLIEAGDVLGKTEIYLDDTPGITVPEIKAKLRRLKNVDLIIIDYLQLMSASRRIDNRVQEISEITRNLKILAKEFSVPVITRSQLSRASEQRAEHKPQLSDLRDSGSIEQDADIVLFLYREDYYNNNSDASDDADRNSGECIVAKNRHGETRSVPLHWQGEFMRFTGVVQENGQ